MSGNGETIADLVKAEIARAKPFIDAGPLTPLKPGATTAWLPSDLILMGFYMIETGRGGIERAAAYVDDMLSEARNRYEAGFYANPFAEPVVVRPA